MLNLKSNSKLSLYKTKVLALAFIVALLTTLVYLPALKNDFVNWDDNLYVYENPNIRSVDFNVFKWIFSFQETMWVPLTRLSHALNYALWKLDPMGHHLTNIVFHGLNTFLVVIVIIRLMESIKFIHPPLKSEKGMPGFRNALISGGVTGILFGIHPLHVESVAWVTERKDVLCGFFVLLSLLSYVSFISISLKKKMIFYYILSLIFFIMALLSKPIAVTLPVVLIILDIYPFERFRFTPGLKPRIAVIIEKIPFFALSIISSIIIMLAHRAMGAIVPLKPYHFVDRLLVAIRALCFYLYKMVLPINLAPFYPYPENISLLTPDFMVSVILIISISGFCVYFWRVQKIWLSVWMFYIVTLLPVLGIIRIGNYAAADRYTYLPSLGVFFLVGMGVALAWEKAGTKKDYLLLRKSFIIIPSLLISGILITMTVTQIKIWKDSITLWSYEMHRFPDNPTAYINRGDAYIKLGLFQKAFEDSNIAIILNPNHAMSYNNRGTAYMKTGRYREALNDFNRSIMLDPYKAKIYNNRGLTYLETGDFQNAFADFNTAITLDPEYAEAYNNRGIIYRVWGNYQKAIEEYTMAINRDTLYAKAYYNRGIVHGILGTYQQAIEDYTIALRLDPKLIRSYNNRGNAYLKSGDYQKAIEDFNTAIELDPGDDKAYLNRGIAFGKSGNYTQATSDYKTSAHLGNKDAQDYLKAKGINW